MKRKKKAKFLQTILPILISCCLIIFCFLIYFIFIRHKEQFLETIDNSIYANITHEAIYGIHLNFKGNFTIPDKATDIKLVFSNGKNEIDIPYTTISNENNILTFSTSELINDGINLEHMPLGTYYLLFKVNVNNEIKYYSVKNDTYSEKYQKTFTNMEYYTLTKNNKNNKIDFEWNTYENCPTLKMTVKETKLPDDIYDITLDPGHGGNDVGAIGTYNNTEYHEANLNLNVALSLKKELENLGYKVAMTRDSDVTVPIYETHGNAILANENKSKFNFALHHNSFAYEVDYLQGLEIYVASNINFEFADLLLSHITKEAHTSISPKETFATKPGIYQRYFTPEEIADDDIQPSNKTTDMIYYYNIRELGGISTQSTNDGRYSKYPKNPYYDANVTTEPYLLELGYVNNSKDLENIINHQDDYAKGIANALEEYLNR